MDVMKRKERKVADHLPPREIREQTAVRRQWLADTVARLEAQPDTVARIVGSGSYQRVVEYRVEQAAARVQERGVCQFCGSQQAVVKGRIAAHGYRRIGYNHGTCPGARQQPANRSIEYAEGLKQEVQSQLSNIVDSLLPNLREGRDAAIREFGRLSDETKAAQRSLREAEHAMYNLRDHLYILDETVLPAHGQPLVEVLV